MKARTRFFARCSSLLACFAGGCSQPVAESVPEPTTVVVAPVPESNPTADPAPKPAQPQSLPPAPPPSFAFPADLTGKELSRVVAPDTVQPLPTERFGTAPKPRPVPAKVLDPDAIARPNFAPPAVPTPRTSSAKPVAPSEKLPIDFGTGAGGVPAKPVLPVAAAATPIARDVNLPPPAPVLGRSTGDRVSLDDPTGELGNAEVVAGSVKVPLAASEFIKVTIPDPFELAEHVKPKVPAAAEPSAAPVPVNPQRTK